MLARALVSERVHFEGRLGSTKDLLFNIAIWSGVAVLFARFLWGPRNSPALSFLFGVLGVIAPPWPTRVVVTTKRFRLGFRSFGLAQIDRVILEKPLQRPIRSRSRNFELIVGCGLRDRGVWVADRPSAVLDALSAVGVKVEDLTIQGTEATSARVMGLDAGGRIVSSDPGFESPVDGADHVAKGQRR